MEKGGLGWLPFVLLCIHHYLYPRIERHICDVFMAGLARVPLCLWVKDGIVSVGARDEEKSRTFLEWNPAPLPGPPNTFSC